MNSTIIRICALAGMFLVGASGRGAAQNDISCRENVGTTVTAGSNETSKEAMFGPGVFVTNDMEVCDTVTVAAPVTAVTENEDCVPGVFCFGGAVEAEEVSASAETHVASTVADVVETEQPAPVAKRRKYENVQPKYAFGVHVGLDLGAAAPWPPANMNAMKMSAVPKLSPSLGISFTAQLPKRFSVSAELTMKQVGIDADAWVSGQQFRMPNPDGEDFITRFRGTANVMMNFSMLELPVYVGYGFNNGRSRIYLGAYYSYILKSSFNTVPLKGLVDNPDNPSEPPIMVTPDKPVPSDVMPVFSNYLGKWDAGILLGYEWQIVPRVNMTARFSMGFKDIFRKGSNYLEYKMLHMRGSIMLSYSLLRYKDQIFKK